MRDSRGITLLALAAVLGLGLWTWSPWSVDQAPPSVPGSQARESQAASGLNAPADLDTPEEEQHPQDRVPVPERETLQADHNVLTGRVLAGGQPLGDVQVEIWRDLLLPSVVRLGQTGTDLQGRFSFQDVERGIHALLLEGPGIPRGYRVERVILADRQDLDLGDLDMPDSSSLTGLVIDEEGRPLEGITVLDSPGRFPQFDPAVREAGLTVLEAVTDHEGRFSFEGVVSGDHSVLAVSPEHIDKYVSGAVEPGAALDLGSVKLSSGRTLVGHVVDPDGVPVVGAQVFPMAVPPGGRPIDGARTGTGGRFELRGVGGFRSLLVRADGYTQWETGNEQLPEPLIVRLERDRTLTGRVEGRGTRKTQVELTGDLRYFSPILGPQLKRKVFPVLEDGTFRIGGLLPQQYSIVATAEGVGRSETLQLLPGGEPVLLTIEPLPRLEILVSDELGRPVQGAGVYSDPKMTPFVDLHGKRVFRGINAESWIQRLISEHDRKPDAITDQRGRAEVPRDPESLLPLAAVHPDHAFGYALVEAGSEVGPVEIVLPRTARLSGRLSAVDARHPSSLSVYIVPAETPDSESSRSGSRTVPVDHEGRFTAERMLPGPYQVSVSRLVVHARAMTGGQLAPITPLLGSGVDMESAQRVELLPGETTEVTLEATPLGTIHGRVLHADRPVPGVVVFAVSSSVSSKVSSIAEGMDKEDAHNSHPYTTTDRDGRYTFLYANPDTWELRARHPDAPASSPMVLASPQRPSMDIELDLHLGAGAVRGFVHPDNLDESVSVHFCRLEQANDPGPLGKSYPVDAEGRFEVRFLPAGNWVLRLVRERTGVVYQRHVRAEPYLVTDLGVLGWKTVDIELAVELPEWTAREPVGMHMFRATQILVRQQLPGRQDRIFVNGYVTRSGLVALSLEPGTYELELTGRSDVQGSPFRTLVVHPDGTTEPASLSFR